MNKKILAVIVISLAVIMVEAPFLVAVHAESKTIVSRGTTAGGKWYTQINVVLGGVHNTIRIPDDWNGKRLNVLCRGFSAVEISPNEIPLDAFSLSLVNGGIATAANHYGFPEFDVKDAIIRTHQLTEYVVNNYGVTGKIILVGVSFGGNVALMLGEKYPELYDGVLDVVGVKDWKAEYEWFKHCADSSISELQAEFTASNLSPFPLTTLEDYQDYCLGASAWIRDYFGSSPEEKPKAYERYSPTYQADIKIPVITLAGARDAIVPLSQHYAYQAAVAEAGHADLYRLVVLPNGAHADLPVQAQIGPWGLKLSAWVVDGIPPP
jgi:pimeloyl-ACP methyl ester carboxylesterase